MRRASFAALLCLFVATPLQGQRVWEDARVLPPGTLSFRAAGLQVFATERFAGAGREALPAPELPLHPDVLGGVPALRTGISELFAELEDAHQQPPPPAAADPSLLTGGEFRARVSYDRRTAPLELSMGILPRVEIAARVPLVRELRHRHAPGFAGASVGANPDPQHNRAVLASFGFGDLGASPLLPVAGSPTGEALAARVAAAGGGELQLPTQPLTFAAYRALLSQTGQDFELEHGDSDWRGAAVEGNVRLLLLSRDPHPAGAAPRFGYRLAAEGTLSRMLIRAPEPYAETAVGEEMLHASGTGAAILLDLLFGDRGELNGLLRSVSRQGRSWTEVAVAPRLRFAGALALGGVYSVVRAGGSGGEGAPAGGAVHLAGAGFSYSTFAASRRDRAVIPAEAALVYRAAVSGTAGFPATRSLSMEGRLFLDLRRR